LVNMPEPRKMSLEDHMNLRTSDILPQVSSHETPRCIFPRPAVASQPAPAKRGRGLLALAALLVAAGGVQAQSVFPATNLGTAVSQTVTVTASAAGTVNKVEVLTQGASGLEYTAGSGTVTTSCTSAALSVNSTCQASVTFTPAYPGVRTGAVVLLDGSNNALGTAYLSGIGVGGLDVLFPGNVRTVAGVYRAWTSTKDGIPATFANVNQPSSVTLDGAGNMYIADSAHNKIRMVCGASATITIAGTTCGGAGIISTVAGTEIPAYTGDGGAASAATLDIPGGVAIDGAGNLYIADTDNNVIRKITASTGIITTVVGNGTAGFGGDHLAATNPSVELNGPWGITVDANGNLYIADTANQRIRRVDAITNIITTVAGDGTLNPSGNGSGTFSGDGLAAINAGLSLPYAVAFDSAGNMYIPDSGNHRIRWVSAVSGAITTASVINTLIGTGALGTACPTGIPVASVVLNTPSGVATDAAGNVYVADTQDSCIRKLNVDSKVVNTISSNLQPAESSFGSLAFAQVYAPIGIFVDGLGNVFYSDYFYMLIDEIQSNKSVLNYVPTPVRQGSQSTPQTQGVENDGNAASNLTAITPDANAGVDPATTTCNPIPYAMSDDADCNIGGIFAPSASGNPLLGNIDVANDSINTPLDIVLIGNATAVNTTTIALASSPNPSEFGKAVTFTASVTTGTGSLTGTVTFTDTFNGTTVQLGSPVGVNSAGVTTFTTASLAVGVHTVSASYNGDSTHFASTTPATVTQSVYEATKTVVSAVPASPSQLGTSVTFTATVSVTDGGAFPLDGSVTFTDSLATFTANTVAITGGVATFTTGALVQGVNVITATYTPNTANLIYGSVGTLKQDVVGTSAVTMTSNPNPSTYGTAVTFAVSVPDSGSVSATGNVNIVVVPVGQTSPTYNLTAKLAGDPAAGTAVTSTLPVGSYNATATYVGDTNYTSSTVALAAPQVVNQVQTSTALAALPTPGIAGKPIAITATVTPSSGTVAPTGTVAFTDTFNGTTVTLGAAIALVKGVAVINPATLAAGTHSIVATYSGDTNDAGSTVTLSLIVVQATTSVTVTATPNPATVQGTITFTATVTGNGGTPTGTVNFLANASIALGTATLNGAGTATVTYSTLPAGSYQITAVYGGDANNGPLSATCFANVCDRRKGARRLVSICASQDARLALCQSSFSNSEAELTKAESGPSSPAARPINRAVSSSRDRSAFKVAALTPNARTALAVLSASSAEP
jgi:sugar lactone lactonase YvrE